MNTNPDDYILTGANLQYRGAKWFDCKLPTEVERWPCDGDLWISPGSRDDFAGEVVREYVRSRTWIWSGRRVYFFCDVHADADAFLLSLVASGGVAKTGPSDEEFELTEEGRTSLFIIGGDCFDKGPLNLRLLEVIYELYQKGAEVELLAGNHDVRTYLGIFYAESRDPLLEHLFVRMGKKTVPLLKEIYDNFVAGQQTQFGQGDEALYDMLFPSENWYQRFPEVAAKWIPRRKLDREVRRIREKSAEFEGRAARIGLTVSQVYEAVKKFRELFFDPGGRYFWFFDRMKLAHQEGSFFFVHAGIDDTMARQVHDLGVDHLNTEFRRLLAQNPFELYHGELGNTFRTKYRDLDYPLTEKGVNALHQSGIYAIVHGHRNLRHGQRLVIRERILNFECDASVDCNTRVVESLTGSGGAVVVFTETGRVNAISTDYPFIKSFYPSSITVSGRA